MNDRKITTTNTGVKIVDNWENICQFCRGMEKSMEDFLGCNGSIKDFKEWRPREEENRDEVKQKTAEKASLEKREVEKGFEGIEEELNGASKDIVESVREIGKEENSGEKLKDASKKIGKTISVKSLESIRSMEEFIFTRFMLKFCPYYFDTEDFSINLERKDDEKYVLRINIMDHKLKTHVQKEVEKKKEEVKEEK